MRLTLLPFGLSVLAITTIASAQTGEDNASRAELIERAQSASERGDHAEAFELAARAARTGMSPALRLFIGLEQGALDRWADAYANAVTCLRETDANSSLVRRAEIAAGCEELRDAARGRIGMLRLQFPRGVGTDVVARVNGRNASLPTIDVPYVVDPGPVTLELMRGSHVLEQRDVVVQRGETIALSFATRPQTRTYSPGPFVLGGVATVAFTTAGIFFGLAELSLGDCVADRNTFTCPSAADAARLQYVFTERVVADIALGIGAAALVGGVMWFVFDRYVTTRAVPTMAASSSARATPVSIEWSF